VSQKNEARIILNILYIFKSVAMKFSTWYPDDLATKRVHYLPPHLIYVSTLPDITQKPKYDTDKLKHWHLGPYSSGHHRQSHWPVANTATCMCKGKATSLRTPVSYTQPALFRATYIIEREAAQHFCFSVMSGSVEA